MSRTPQVLAAETHSSSRREREIPLISLVYRGAMATLTASMVFPTLGPIRRRLSDTPQTLRSTTTLPPLRTIFILSMSCNTLISLRGSPSTTTMSVNFALSGVPTFSTKPAASAAFLVAETMASMGVVEKAQLLAGLIAALEGASKPRAR